MYFLGCKSSLELKNQLLIYNHKFLSSWISKIHQICCRNSTIAPTITRICYLSTLPYRIHNKFLPKTSDCSKNKTSFRFESDKSKRKTLSFFRPSKPWMTNWKGTENEGIPKKDFLLSPSTNAILKNAKELTGQKPPLRTTSRGNTERTCPKTRKLRIKALKNDAIFLYVYVIKLHAYQ